MDEADEVEEEEEEDDDNDAGGKKLWSIEIIEMIDKSKNVAHCGRKSIYRRTLTDA